MKETFSKITLILVLISIVITKGDNPPTVDECNKVWNSNEEYIKIECSCMQDLDICKSTLVDDKICEKDTLVDYYKNLDSCDVVLKDCSSSDLNNCSKNMCEFNADIHQLHEPKQMYTGASKISQKKITFILALVTFVITKGDEQAEQADQPVKPPSVEECTKIMESNELYKYDDCLTFITCMTEKKCTPLPAKSDRRVRNIGSVHGFGDFVRGHVAKVADDLNREE
uniref:Uncharacterized protein n=1 Tax=Meloidogyne floridensis TaxID=298350 RepID=A0A915P317_9BILA